ncbi:multiple ankyrin repeats single kh domain protein [Fusarium sp. NRRL 25303]|nr:multiple ankyrin repeats single kh domain protein [Fusarium sp. NRRL 25303]
MSTARRNISLPAYPSGSHDQLFYASWSGDESCVKMLLGSGDTAGWDLDSALHVASDVGNLDTVALLIRQGADVNAKGATHGLLCSAVRADHAHIVPLVITEDVAVSTQPRLSNPLRIASRSGRLDIIDLPMKGGADINAESDTGTALDSASDYGSDISTYLLLDGPDASAQTREDNALQSASGSDDLGWVRFLLEQGADIDAVL